MNAVWYGLFPVSLGFPSSCLAFFLSSGGPKGKAKQQTKHKQAKKPRKQKKQSKTQRQKHTKQNNNKAK